MSELLKIDDEVISTEDFVKLLKFTGRYDELMEDIVKDKLTIHAARKQGISAGAEEIQERADQLRRVRGLHRASDMNRYLDRTGITLDDFEKFVTEMLLHEKMTDSKKYSRKERKKAVDTYLTLLKSGGSDHPITLLQRAGVDFTTPAPTQAMVDRMTMLVDKLEQKLIEVGKLPKK